MHEEEEDYIHRFMAAGYFSKDDIENLREITEEELQKSIGVTKTGLLSIVDEARTDIHVVTTTAIQLTGRDS